MKTAGKNLFGHHCEGQRAVERDVRAAFRSRLFDEIGSAIDDRVYWMIRDRLIDPIRTLFQP
jgi:hypothetical protein